MTNQDTSSRHQQQQQNVMSSSLDPPAAVNDELAVAPSADVAVDNIATIEPENPSQRTIKLWHEVALGIDKNQTVVWKNAVDSLEDGLQYLHTSDDARAFVERYMRPVISILLEQVPHKIGQNERNCVEGSLQLALQIIEEDIKLKVASESTISTEQSLVIDVLAMVFNKKKQYYKGSKSSWNNSINGLPDVRNNLIYKFRSHGMFGILATYLHTRAGTSQFPPLDDVHQFLVAAIEAMPQKKNKEYIDRPSIRTAIENDLIGVCKAVLKHLIEASDEYLKKQQNQILTTMRYDLQNFFDPLFETRAEETFAFYGFCRDFALKLISSQSLPLKLFGWETIGELIEAAQSDFNPPPKIFIVSQAGTPFVNGVYHFASNLTKDGYVAPRSDLKYEHVVEEETGDNNNTQTNGATAGEKHKKKIITLFRCTMRSQQKWWFLSEADENAPGTDKDIDYYQHKSKKDEEDLPPSAGWATCREGSDPPPRLEPKGIMVPPGEEYNTMEHQLAKWAIDNKIVELVLGKSIHREVVARSTQLLRFLANMCTKDDQNEFAEQASNVGPNAYCLQASHLTLAWNMCKSKLDPAVSAEVYHLLVSILPSLPHSLAVHLLNTIQKSLNDSGKGNNDHLFEVAEFCSTLAGGNSESNVDTGYIYVSDEVRGVILNLLWKVVTHPEAHTLKCYNTLKHYITQELRVEPMGTIHRDLFLRFCKQSLIKNSTTDQIDESVALRMVNLTKFILEACPQDQSAQLVFANNAELAKLVFDELIFYLNRRSSIDTTIAIRKTSSNLLTSSDFRHTNALTERLNIIRYVYGISGTVEMTTTQLQSLWNICVSAEDREAIMVFLADASSHNAMHGTSMSVHVHQPLTSSYSNEVQLYAFQSLFCRADLDWENLGLNAYQSFQILYSSLKSILRSFESVEVHALDTLWRICLCAGNDDVASQAMKDLLQLYSTMSASRQAANSNNAWTQKNAQKIPAKVEAFADKIYSCLETVREGLKSGDRLSERSAERCMQILNAAITHTGDGSKVNPTSTVYFQPSSMNGLVHDFKDIIHQIPHGLRGQACYRTISISAKRASSGQRPATINFLLQVHPVESLWSINKKVSRHCNHDQSLVKPISFNNNRSNLNIEPDSATVDELGIVDGSEVVYLLCANTVPQKQTKKNGQFNKHLSGLTMADIFGANQQGPSDKFFAMLLDMLEVLPVTTQETNNNIETQTLVWNLLQSVPSNEGICDKVRIVAQCPISTLATKDEGGIQGGKIDEEMSIDIQRKDLEWDNLLDLKHYQRAVYVLEIIDSFLQPSLEFVEHVDNCNAISSTIINDATSFRQAFIDSGGFDATIRFFSRSRTFHGCQSKSFRRENDYILRIVKCCLIGRSDPEVLDSNKALHRHFSDNLGKSIVKSLSKSIAFFTNLSWAIVSDNGVSVNAIMNGLFILQSLFLSDHESPSIFSSMSDDLGEKLIIMMLMWETNNPLNTVNISVCRHIRKTTENLILLTPVLSAHAIPWFIKALQNIDYSADSSEEYFSSLIRLVELDQEEDRLKISQAHFSCLSSTLCRKISQCPRPGISSNTSTGVLCGLLRLLRALICNGTLSMLADGIIILLNDMPITPWSLTGPSVNDEDSVIINLMGVIFDAFLCDGSNASQLAFCSDDLSRRLGFDVLIACANACHSGDGYVALSSRIRKMISSSAPFLRPRWGHHLSGDDIGTLHATTNNSQYSGLKNQGCTCYMNSVLQQLFMMPELRKNLCSATLPSNLRCTGGAVKAMESNTDLVGKCVTMHWENGSSYEAVVEAYDETTQMHRIRYLLPQTSGASSVSGNRGHNVQTDFSKLPGDLPDEFILIEGRPGKETGVFEILNQNKNDNKNSSKISNQGKSKLHETEDEISFRRLLEEVQKTFVHLDKGSRGRAFDPRSLVEASGCLKLEFDVWQQNDASEFAMKLLDKLEVPLKRWSPTHFRFLEHTFRLKQTKQKLCKECGLKTNREENLMNIDCQIRGKSDIHEALSTMCEVEYMEGDNKVYCDNCKKNCDTVLRTAISALPDMLILSLKRFDLDYNTFETVKLNSRCAFEQSLNMKKYTLEGVEAMEKSASLSEGDPSYCDDILVDPLSILPDEDYEYKLAGVLVHHGVAQGGHYYSFIRDRTSDMNGETDKWFKFDDDEVTPFDASQIEVECFGGRVKKETKWPNGQVNTVETEQLANALMLFYEKVKPSKFDNNLAGKEADSEDIPSDVNLTTGIEVFENDVRQSNTVHRSHAFLFDTEFKTFLRKIVDIAISSDVENTNSKIHPTSEKTSSGVSWRTPIVELAVVYYFDVLLHSVDEKTLDDWTERLSTALCFHGEGSIWFVHELAKRTKMISHNWLRIFASDCPESSSRSAAMRVIGTSLRKCLCNPRELSALKSWTQAWIRQLNTGGLDVVPSSLNGKWQHLENLNRMERGESSSIGIIISFICLLLDLAPRSWQYNAELCGMLRELGSTPIEENGNILREAMVASQIPARLIALLLRDKSPAVIQKALPGTCLSFEMSEAITRVVSSPTAHIFPMNSGVGRSSVASTPSPLDQINALEALALIIGVNGAKSAQLVCESGESKGRTTYDLTPRAKEALTILFKEIASRQGTSMNQNDMVHYMTSCGVNTSSMTTQRISNILSRYGNENKELTIDGFLAYYRDISQSNSMQLRNDLMTFGFRPDLSRAHLDSRSFLNAVMSKKYTRIESVAMDMFQMQRLKIPPGPLAEAGLASLQLYHTIFFTDSYLTEYLLAWSCVNQDTDKLLTETLRTLYHAQSWGNESIQICVTVLMVLAALPDNKQKQRIGFMMQCQEKLNVRGDVGSGLLVVAKELALSHAAQQYSSEYHNHRAMLGRYVDAIKELQNIKSVQQWMSENKEQCEWIDPFLRSDASDSPDRGDYLNRRERVGNSQSTLYEHGQSDSDLNGDIMNDSDESDEFLESESRSGTVVVKGAGVNAVNGTYFSINKLHDGVQMFVRKCMFQGKETEFSLFRCVLSDRTRRWYISIIPSNNKPGTSKDIDFYFCHSSGHVNELPHGLTWNTSKDNGLDPAPIVDYKSQSTSVSDEHDDNMDDQVTPEDMGHSSSPILNLMQNADESSMEDDTL